MDQRERYYGVLYGRRINRRHLERIWKKFNYYYSHMSKEEQDECSEVVLELLDTIDPHPVRYDYSVCILLKKEFLPRFVEIMQGIPGTFWLCEFTHGHLEVEISGILYEGLCYKTINDSRLIFFNGSSGDTGDLVRHRLSQLPEDRHYLKFNPSTQGEKINEAFADWIKGISDLDRNGNCRVSSSCT